MPSIFKLWLVRTILRAESRLRNIAALDCPCVLIGYLRRRVLVSRCLAVFLFGWEGRLSGVE